MKIIIHRIGEESPEGFNIAIQTLMKSQTIWDFTVGEPIPKPYSFKAQDHLNALPLRSSYYDFSIGISSGRIDQQYSLNIFDGGTNKAVISEFDIFMNLRDKSQTKIFWILSLFNIALRASLGKTCDKPECFCSGTLTIHNLLIKLVTLDICADCNKIMKERFKYNEHDLRELLFIIRRPNKYSDTPIFEGPYLPILERQINTQVEKHGTNVFKEYGIIVVMHYLEDLIPFLEGIIRLGARPEAIALIVKPYPYSERVKVHRYIISKYKDVVIEYLNELPPNDIILKRLIDEIRSRSSSGKIIVVEDGGYVVPYLHKICTPEDNFTIGAVEQTTKGINRDKEIKEDKFLFPILDVAKSSFKDEYEAPLVGKAITYNIQRLLPEASLPGKKALVIGFGAVGRQVANALQRLGLIVRVSDDDDKRIIAARVRGFEAGPAETFAGDSSIIIGTTGRQSVSRKVIANLVNGAILISASSDQIEIDINHLEKIKKEKIYSERIGTEYEVVKKGAPYKYLLVADGFPINFFYSSGIPNEAIDPILAQIFIGAVEIARSHGGMGTGIKEGMMDELIVENEMLKDFIDVYNK